MKYLIAIILPSEINHKIELIQQEYKNDHWNIALPPHITLMPPVHPILSSDMTLKIIEEAVANVKKFEIETTDIGYFHNYYRVIYAKVENSSKLNELYKKINSRADKIGKFHKENKGFIPHITLSNDLTEEEFNQRYLKIQKTVFNSKFICDKVLLFAKGDNQRKYQVVDEVKLGE